jgi:hypothetical protein
MDDVWVRYRQLLAEHRFDEALAEAKRVAPMEVPAGFDRDFYIEHMVRNHVDVELGRKSMSTETAEKTPEEPTITWQELVREEAKKVPAWAEANIGNDFADYVLYEHTGFPGFWDIPKDGKDGIECCRTQVRKFFETHKPSAGASK